MSTIDIHKLRERRGARELEEAFEARDFRRAISLANEAVRDTQASKGEGPELADALADLAHALRGGGDLVEAAEVSLEALEMEERLHGREHARTGEALHRLAQLQLDAKNTVDALALFERALTVLEAACGEADPRVAVACSGLAAAFAQNGDLASAAKAIEKSLQCLALAGGPENPDLLAPLDALAQLREADGGSDDALSLRERAVRIARRARTSELPRQLILLARLAINASRFDRGESAATEVLTVEQKHTPVRGEAHTLLGEILERRQEFVPAREQYRYALETLRQALPERHPQLAVAMMNVATLDIALGEGDRAEPLAKDALAIFLDNFGPTHPHTRHMREGLRVAFLDSGLTRAAEEIQTFGLAQ